MKWTKWCVQQIPSEPRTFSDPVGQRGWGWASARAAVLAQLSDGVSHPHGATSAHISHQNNDVSSSPTALLHVLFRITSATYVIFYLHCFFAIHCHTRGDQLVVMICMNRIYVFGA